MVGELGPKGDSSPAAAETEISKGGNGDNAVADRLGEEMMRTNCSIVTQTPRDR